MDKKTQSVIQESCEAIWREAHDWSQHKPPRKLAHTHSTRAYWLWQEFGFSSLPPVIFRFNTQDGKTYGPHVYIFAYLLKFLLAVTKCQRNAPSWRRCLFGPVVKGDSLSQWGRCGWKSRPSLWRLPVHIRVHGVTLSQSSSGLLSDTPKGEPYCCLQCSVSSS